MMEVLGGIVIIGVLFFVCWRLESGQNTLGDFAGFITVLLLAGQPVRALGNLAGYVQRGLAATQRILTFDAATFSYEGDTRPALDHVSLTVPGGSRLALVGRSAAGKSTLFNLIPRLFDPTSGRVLIDGQDIAKVTLESLRANIALVTQDSILFNDTVGANIAIGTREGRADQVPQEAIERAARAAAAHDFIEALPKGYGTEIGVGGDRLSGGQRQRLSIARAFLRDAPILLLDEATSALDAEAEAQVRVALERLSRGRTTIVIAHRLSTIMDADQIAVLDRGQLVEVGRHYELLERDGVYASLFRL
jgi:subfamily B ATP-binding cassette protein MsbA